MTENENDHAKKSVNYSTTAYQNGLVKVEISTSLGERVAFVFDVAAVRGLALQLLNSARDAERYAEEAAQASKEAANG